MTDEAITFEGMEALQGEFLNPYDYPELWHHLYLNQLQLPGLCVDCAGSNPRKWDVQDGKGSSGAAIVYNGDGLAEFSAFIQLGWRGPMFPSPREQFAEWDRIKPLLRPPTEKNPSALSIYYPNLMLLPIPIVAVVVVNVIGPKIMTGVHEFEVQFRQYRAPAPASATPKGAKTSTNEDGSKTPGAQDEADKIISSLTDELLGDLL